MKIDLEYVNNWHCCQNCDYVSYDALSCGYCGNEKAELYRQIVVDDNTSTAASCSYYNNTFYNIVYSNYERIEDFRCFALLYRKHSDGDVFDWVECKVNMEHFNAICLVPLDANFIREYYTFTDFNRKYKANEIVVKKNNHIAHKQGVEFIGGMQVLHSWSYVEDNNKEDI